MNCRIRTIVRDISTAQDLGAVSTLAGSYCGSYADGTGTNAIIGNVGGPAVYLNSGFSGAGVYGIGPPIVFFPAHGDRISAAFADSGATFSVAGGMGSGTADGIGTVAQFNSPAGVCFSDYREPLLFVADSNNRLIRMIPLTPGYSGLVPPLTVSTIAGGGSGTGGTPSADGDGTSATFGKPTGCSAYREYLYVADQNFNTIRRISVQSPFAVITMAGDGSPGYADGDGTNARFNQPFSLSYDDPTSAV